VVRQAIDRLKRLAEADQDPKIQFLANPVFQQSVDEATGELVFTSESMDYRVLGVRADSEEIVNQYREFCDWYARLNTFLRPGSRLPFARLMVNEALARRGEIPSRIVLVLRSRRALGTHEERLRGEHRLLKRLVESDLRRIAQAGEQMAAFKKVGFGQYEESRRPKETAPDK
ncbi:MAG: hypothetical protein JW719_04055, partial [Pirellulales bacterium]|nr:hypothetical protein [Pirellulales bacterium]